MNAPTTQVSGLPSSSDAYMRHGWKLIAIPPNSKGPNHKGWNEHSGCMVEGSSLPPDWNIGLAHAYSGTMALDIDDWGKAEAYLKERGIDLNELFNALDAVQINSGNPGHGKLLFAMPFGMTMASKKIMVDGVTAFELRCGTNDGKTVQDVLPPSRHPSGTTYRWEGKGNWQNLPMLPIELLTLWEQLISKDAERSIPNSNSSPASWNEVVSALQAISPDCDRKTWIEVGMALQSSGNADAFATWDGWSSGSDKYRHSEMASQWRSFKELPNGISIGTLFHHAKEAGWVRPSPDVSELFGPVKQSPENVLKYLRSEIPPPAVDLALWPDVLSERAREIASEVGCDPVVPLMAGLASVCAAADKRTKLKITDSWSVPPILWLMTVGAPADKKSPGSRPMFSPLKQLEIEDRPRHQSAMMFWQGKEARHAAQSKQYREWASSPEADIPNAVPPLPEELPKEPQSLRLLVNDATSQKVVHMASGRPRGFLLYLDEMNHWLSKLNDPRSGEDRGCWIQGYEGGSYNMDRVSSGSIQADNLAIGIYGNCQPEVFKHHMNAASNDGLVQRFVPVVLNGKYTTMWQDSLPEFMSHAPAYEAMIRQVFALPEHEVSCSPEAIQQFREFSHWYLEGRRLDTLLNASPIYMTAVGKVEGTCARLALLLHLIETPHSRILSGEVMARAVAIMRQFIVPSLRYSFMEIVGLKDELSGWIVEYIIQLASVRPTVSMSELKRASKRQLGDRSAWQAENDIRVVMDELQDAGYVELFSDYGRHTVWTVNASLATIYDDYRRKIISAKQEIIQHFKDEAIKFKGKVSKYHRDAIGYEPEKFPRA